MGNGGDSRGRGVACAGVPGETKFRRGGLARASLTSVKDVPARYLIRDGSDLHVLYRSQAKSPRDAWGKPEAWPAPVEDWSGPF